MRIRDRDSSDQGSKMEKSRIRDKHPGSATLSTGTWGGRAAVRWSGQSWTPGADGPHSLPASGPDPRSENQ
jgi:hypothetical protein